MKGELFGLGGSSCSKKKHTETGGGKSLEITYVSRKTGLLTSTPGLVGAPGLSSRPMAPMCKGPGAVLQMEACIPYV